MINLAVIHKIDQLRDFEERIHAAAIMYIQQGIYVIPVMPNDKSLPYPVKKYHINYSHASRNKKIIDKWFGAGGMFRGFNIGIACGRKGGVFAVDIDLKDKKGNSGYESLEKLEEKHGKLSAPVQSTPTGGKHYIYMWADFAKSSTSKLGLAIDTRGGDENACKSHIVAYPSIRPEGIYKWIEGGDIPEMPKWMTEEMGIPWGGNSNRGSEEVDEEDLETKYTPRQVWKMLSHIDPNELDYDNWLYCLQAIHSQHPDEIGFRMADKWSQRGSRYKASEVSLRWKSFDDSGSIRIGTLIFFAQQGGFNPKLEPRGADEPSMDADELVAEYNKKFGIVMVGSKLRVLLESDNPDPFRENFMLLTVTDFKNYCANDFIMMADTKGREKLVPKADIWFSEVKRRTYINGLCFAPNEAKDWKGCFNVWQGWPYEEIEGDWSLFKSHILVMCAGNEYHCLWMLDWMADAVQDPMNPKGCAVVMKGREGTGKGTVANVFGKLFGSHYKHVIQEEQLIGRFNGHLQDALIVFADEVTYGGNKKVAGTLKGMVTEKYLMVERKGIDATSFRNCMRLMIASNEDWFLPAGPQSRRWFVLDIPADVTSNKAYFDSLYGQMDAGGYEAMMYELKHRKITVDLRKAPETSLLMDQRARYASTDSIVEWWAHKIEGSVLGISGYEELGEEIDWPKYGNRADFYADYQDWCRDSGARRQSKPAFFAKLERDFGLHKCRPANPNGNTRATMYEIPNHSKCIYILADMAGIEIKEESDDE